MSRRVVGAVALGLAGVLTAAGCSSGSSSGAAPATSAAAPTKAAPTSAAAPAPTSKAAPVASTPGATTAPAPTSAVAPPSSAPSSAADISGNITVLTNRTDLTADGTFKKYGAAFEALYPKVKVKFESITDYEGVVKIRMNTKNYGDVLLIPNALGAADYPKFFSPLGSAATLSALYHYTPTSTVGGQVYGIAQNGNANGFVYNKAVWAKAGITSDPTTPDQFISDLQAIKAKTTSIPYYTNYKDGWPLSNWESAVGSATCDPDAVNKLATDQNPWAAGTDLNIIDTLLYNIAHDKLIEPDPTTTNWESSKGLLATQKIATMWLGSWAISQMQAAATKAGTDPAQIGFMPFPTQKGGKFCSVAGPDYQQAINKNSKYQAADRAWIDWFTNKSGYAQTQGSIPTSKTGAQPATLADYTKLGVTYIELTPAPANQVGLVSKIDAASEIGINSPDYRQKLVDVARGAASGSLDGTFADLNKKWAAGITKAG